MFADSTLFRLLFPRSVELPPRTNGYFGKENDKSPPPDDVEIRKFTIKFEDFDELNSRLDQVRLAESIDTGSFKYGFNSATLRDVVHYWRNTYNWHHWEQELNKYDQFKTQIEGLDVHFVHVSPHNPSGVVLPLLLIHGWPGSFFEYYKTIPLLTDPTKTGLSFHLVIPSIPGYGFSEAPHKEGFNVISAARVFVKLMTRLGYKQFFVHGGDWGSYISRTIALMYPERVRGLHITLCSNTVPQGCNILKYWAAKYLPMLMFYNQNSQKVMFNEMQSHRSRWYLESGYSHIQSTKPDTIGASLTDSPVGLAAYILEKFSTWTNGVNVYKPDGNLTGKFTLDELLTNVMIYWISGNITSSMRFYRENLSPQHGVLMKYNLAAVKVPDSVPVGYAVFPHEIIRLPEFVFRINHPNLVHYKEMADGGHFAAFEEPQMLAEDVRSFACTVVSKI